MSEPTTGLCGECWTTTTSLGSFVHHSCSDLPGHKTRHSCHCGAEVWNEATTVNPSDNADRKERATDELKGITDG